MHALLTIVSTLLAVIGQRKRHVTALSSPPVSRQFVELKKASSLPNDRLPASFIDQWPTWVLDSSSAADGKWTKIPDDGGYVPPTSIDELWQPMDLNYPSCRLALGLHIRNGSIRHILPAVDLTLGDSNHQYRNRGLCSVPRAYEWMDFGSLSLGGGLQACRLVLQSREKDKSSWTSHAMCDAVDEVLSLALEALADDPPDELGEESCLIHVPCNSAAQPDLSSIPPVGSDLRALLLEEDGTVLGRLHVKVIKTEAGSESEYMPTAYTSLFQDESLRKPAYVEMKRRMDQKKGNTYE